MACACQGKNAAKKFKFVSGDRTIVKVYTNEVEAKAAVIRHGGNYSPMPG